MENEFLDKMEDNAVVRVWSEKTQLEKRDSLIEGYTLELWDFTRISVTQNDFQKLREIWVQWDDEVNCFTFGKVNLVPIVEEYTALLRYLKIQVDRVYSRTVNVPTFVKKMMNIIGISEQWFTARIKRKGESKCIPWKNLRDLILAHSDTKKKEGHTCPSNFGRNIQIFECVSKGGRGKIYWMCTILLVWFHSHFWKFDKVSYRVFFEYYSPLKELAAIPRLGDITEERWMAIFQNLQDEDVEWKAPWLVPDDILYRCGDFD
ncbi:hypothetical protein Gorai_014357 [Gossypium raimondii]|uniref:DUF7745 domain-containing protein n=1 Tax=Gossypium raimondii TaxID=29730 RepID=A0A7J8P2S4_GOSRA|nr:hypothetical protein [Gossypium raimondii]